MSKADDVLLFDVALIVVLGLYGAGIGVAGFTALQNLPSPQVNQQALTVCSQSGIIAATECVGWSIVNIPVLFGYIVVLAILFGNIVLTTVFSPALSNNGVPFLGFFFLAIQVYVIWELVRTVRGSSVGV